MNLSLRRATRLQRAVVTVRLIGPLKCRKAALLSKAASCEPSETAYRI